MLSAINPKLHTNDQMDALNPMTKPCLWGLVKSDNKRHTVGINSVSPIVNKAINNQRVKSNDISEHPSKPTQHANKLKNNNW